MTKSILSILIMIWWFLSGTACTVESSDLVPLKDCTVQVANAILDSIHDDLKLQDVLRNQQIDVEAVNDHIDTRILKRIILLRATAVDVSALKGIPLETLCLLTSDSVRAQLAQARDDQMRKIAFGYLDTIEKEVGREVSRIQETMLGTGCSLSP